MCALALAVLASVAAATGVNYYKLLGVKKTADTATIKKAFKDMAKKYHPDKYKGPSPVKMEDLNRAHEVLTDPDLRKKYDMHGKDPDDFEVQRAEDRRQRQQEYAQFHNMFGRRQHQNIESQTQTLTMHNYEVTGRRPGRVRPGRSDHMPRCRAAAAPRRTPTGVSAVAARTHAPVRLAARGDHGAAATCMPHAVAGCADVVCLSRMRTRCMWGRPPGVGRRAGTIMADPSVEGQQLPALPQNSPGMGGGSKRAQGHHGCAGAVWSGGRV